MRRLLLLATLLSLPALSIGCCHDHCWRPSKKCAECQGCGDVYWGDWIDYPPPHCDPCDNCGNWIGPDPHDDYQMALHTSYSESMQAGPTIYAGQMSTSEPQRVYGEPTLAEPPETIYQR